jgi:hypothetical protein
MAVGDVNGEDKKVDESWTVVDFGINDVEFWGSLATEVT